MFDEEVVCQITLMLAKEGPSTEGHLFRSLPDVTWGTFQECIQFLDYTEQIASDPQGKWCLL